MDGKSVIYSAVAIFLSLSMSSCTSMNSYRNPASNADELSVHEQQILSKNAVYQAMSSSKNKKDVAAAAAFQLSANEAQELPAILEKLKKILHHPFGINTHNPGALMSSGMDRNPEKKEVRITSWNIERGQQLEKISSFITVSSGGQCNRAQAQNILKSKNDKKGERAIDELCALSESDILILNEVDFGVCRSGYKAVASAIASRLNMNYVYAPSFYEAEPAKNGLEKNTDPFCVSEKTEQTKNLTGNALLSRFPLNHVQVIPLPVGYVTKEGEPATADNNDTYCYDWHEDEIKGASLIDKGVQLGAKYIFNETIKRELRYGGRNAIVADVELPGGSTVTVVAAHLENKSKPSCRLAQMRYIMNRVNTSHPLVIGGDMNTTGTDGGRKEIKNTIWDITLSQTVKSQNFWLNIFGLSNPVTAMLGYGKQAFRKLTTTQNPTRVDAKWLRDNPEGALFSYIKDQGFVWKGNAQDSLSGKNEGPWSTTNARDKIGFVGTHYLNRTYGMEGISKLDWLFVHTKGDQCAHSKFPRTLGAIRQQIGRDEFPSDHVPITLLLEVPCS